MTSALLRLSMLMFLVPAAYCLVAFPLTKLLPAVFFALVIVSALALWVIVKWVKTGLRNLSVSEVLSKAVYAPIALLISCFFYATYVGALDLGLKFGTWATQGSGATLSLAVALGLLLFVARLRFRTVYGAAEVFAGLLVATTSFDGVTLVTNAFDRSLVLTFLTAAVLLIVRGLDNIHQGATKEPIDPIGGKLLVWLSRPLTK